MGSKSSRVRSVALAAALLLSATLSACGGGGSLALGGTPASMHTLGTVTVGVSTSSLGLSAPRGSLLGQPTSLQALPSNVTQLRVHLQDPTSRLDVAAAQVVAWDGVAATVAVTFNSVPAGMLRVYVEGLDAAGALVADAAASVVVSGAAAVNCDLSPSSVATLVASTYRPGQATDGATLVGYLEDSTGALMPGAKSASFTPPVLTDSLMLASDDVHHIVAVASYANAQSRVGGNITTFLVDPQTGDVKQSLSDPYPVTGLKAIAIAQGPTGTLLYALDEMGGLYAFAVDANGNLSFVASGTLNARPGETPIQTAYMRATSTGQVYVALAGFTTLASSITQLSLNGSSIVQVAKTAAVPIGQMLLSPDQQHLYVNAPIVTEYDASLGAVTSPFNLGPFAQVALSAQGDLLFGATNSAVGGGVLIKPPASVDPSTGQLTPSPSTAAFQGGLSCQSLVASSRAKNLYMGDRQPAGFYLWNLDVSTGSVVASGSPTPLPGGTASTTDQVQLVEVR